MLKSSLGFCFNDIYHFDNNVGTNNEFAKYFKYLFFRQNYMLLPEFCKIVRLLLTAVNINE